MPIPKLVKRIHHCLVLVQLIPCFDEFWLGFQICPILLILHFCQFPMLIKSKKVSRDLAIKQGRTQEIFSRGAVDAGKPMVK